MKLHQLEEEKKRAEVRLGVAAKLVEGLSIELMNLGVSWDCVTHLETGDPIFRLSCRGAIADAVYGLEYKVSRLVIAQATRTPV